MSRPIGILIIGSLYWDDRDHRRAWRGERLDMGRPTHVRAPIRYGRKSATRGHTYTMVFSAEVDRANEKLGRAVVVPCRRAVQSPSDLIEEAQALWRAELPPDSRPGDVSADWGSVAIVQNPNRPLGAGILEGWAERAKSEVTYGRLCHSDDEEAIVDATGRLNISWPADAPDSYSALLVAATNPTLIGGRYPSVETMVEAWNTSTGRKHKEYFENNRKHGIRTFQDEKISRRLNGVSAQPGAVADHEAFGAEG